MSQSHPHLTISLKIGIVSVCSIYIAKSLLRDLAEFRKSRRQKQRNLEKGSDDAGGRTLKNGTRQSLGDNSALSSSSIEEEYRIPDLIEENGGNQCEVLVHNIAHTDLIFELMTTESKSNVESILGRPRFSAFSLFSGMVLNRLQEAMKNGDLDLALFPVYDRKEMKLTTPRKQRNIPVGFKNFGLLPLSGMFCLYLFYFYSSSFSLC